MKTFLIACATGIAAACPLLFCACGGLKINPDLWEGDFGGAPTSYVYTMDGEDFEEGDTFYDYLLSLRADGALQFETTAGQYGPYITSVGGLEERSESAASGYSWMIYTDLEEYGGVIYSDASYGTWEHGGKLLNSASYGVSALPLAEGYTYALVYVRWSY